MTSVRQADRELRVVVSKQDKILGDLGEKGRGRYVNGIHFKPVQW